MSKATMNMITHGTEPILSDKQRVELAGMLCAVEFGTREILAHGTTWREVKQELNRLQLAEKEFYKYEIPVMVFDELNTTGLKSDDK